MEAPAAAAGRLCLGFLSGETARIGAASTGNSALRLIANIRMDKLRPYLALLIVSLVLYIPVMTRAAAAQADFGGHILLALALPDSTRNVFHVLFHAVFLSIHRLAPSIPHSTAALLAILLLMTPVPMMAFALLRKATGDALPASLLIALSLALTILAPVAIWPSRSMLGYFNPVVYHNPTSIAARLFVIPLSLLALRIFQPGAIGSLNQKLYITLLSGAVVLLATLAKPSFTFVLLPGCCLFALWRRLRRQRVDWVLLVFGFCLPGACLLGLLHLLAYESAGGSTYAVGLFTTMRYWIPTWRIPIQFLLSLVFPLAVLALYYERACRHLYVKLCWLIFAVSAAIAYLLYEGGDRLGHGNFVWGSYNAIFLLMFASLWFLLEQHRREQHQGSADLSVAGFRVSRRVAIACIAFALHLICGIAYYVRFATEF